MIGLLASPRFVALVMVGVVVEGVVLALYRRRTGRGVPIPEVVSFLGAGLALLGALLVALEGRGTPASAAGQGTFAAAMAAALGCHVWHLRQRWNV